MLCVLRNCYILFPVTGCLSFTFTNSWLRMQHDTDLVEKFSGKNREFLHLYFVAMETTLAMIGCVATFTTLVNSIFFQLIGVSIVATVFGQFGSMMADFNARESQWQQLMMERCAMMRFMQIPEETQYRIRKYYEYQREQSEHGFISSDITKEFVQSLSRPLRSEVLLFTHRQQLDSISVFQKCSHEAVQSIITNLKMEIYLPGDYVVTHGSVGDTFFFAYIWSMRYFE